jgi:hypothetical protein
MLVHQSVWRGLVQLVLIGPRNTELVPQPTHCTARLATLFSVGGLLIPAARPRALAACPAAVSPTEAAASSPFAAFGHRAAGRACNTTKAVTGCRVACVGPTTPKRARRLADASVDPTDARKLS